MNERCPKCSAPVTRTRVDGALDNCDCRSCVEWRYIGDDAVRAAGNALGAGPRTELEALREWLANGSAYMEHPDGMKGTGRAVEALDVILTGGAGGTPPIALVQLRADAVRRDDARAVALCDVLETVWARGAAGAGL